MDEARDLKATNFAIGADDSDLKATLEVETMGKTLVLRDVLQFLCHDGDDKESAGNVQICFKNDEWDDFEEVNAASEMLKPFLDCEVTCMDADKSVLMKDECCIRVSIDETSLHMQAGR